ncbi:hypothetical protein EMIT0P228_130176 [Pseudomonas brassicacearum]
MLPPPERSHRETEPTSYTEYSYKSPQKKCVMDFFKEKEWPFLTIPKPYEQCALSPPYPPAGSPLKSALFIESN